MLGDTGWINAVPPVPRHPGPAELAVRHGVGLPGPRDHRHLGHRGRASSSISPACAGSRPSCTTRPGSTAPAGWAQLRHVTIPMMSPVIFYSLILAMVAVLQYFLVPLVLNNGTGEPGGSTLFYNLYIFKTFFTFQQMSYGATLAWLLFVIALLVTVVLFRPRGGGSTTRASGETAMKAVEEIGGIGEATGVIDRRSGSTARHRLGHANDDPDPGDDRDHRRVPVAAAPQRDRIGPKPGADEPAQLAGPAVRPALPSSSRARRTTSTRCRSTAPSASSRWSRRAARRASSSTRPTPAPGLINWEGSWRTLAASLGASRRSGRTTRGLGAHRLPASLLRNTILIAIIGDDRDGHVVHARRLRVRPLPIPRAAACCSRC